MSVSNKKWTAIVPIRGGSRGLPGKNMRSLLGKPLFLHSVEHALDAGAQRVIITTDIAEVERLELPQKVEVLRRPQSLCEDTSQMDAVLVHALKTCSCSGVVVLLQATSPLRQPSDIEAGLSLFAENKFDLIMSVTPADRGVLKWGSLDGGRYVPISSPSYCFSNRQQLPLVYKPNGAIYVFDSACFIERGGFVTDRIGALEMPNENSLDVDTEVDFQRCEQLLRGRHGENMETSES